MNDFEFLQDKTTIADVIFNYTGNGMRKVGAKTYRINPCPMPGCSANDAFSVDVEKGLFNCFSCGSKGNMFEFVKQYKKFSEWRPVIQEFCKFLNIPENTLPTFKTPKNGNGHAPKPVDTFLKTHKNIFRISANWYHQTLLKTPKALEILKKTRKYDKGFLEKMPIGYTGNTRGKLLEYLRKESFTDDDLLKSGLFRKNDKGAIYELFGEQYFIFFHVENNQVGDFSVKDAFKGKRKEERKGYRLEAKYRLCKSAAFGVEDIHQNGLIFVEGQHDLLQIKNIDIKQAVIADKDFTNVDYYLKHLKNNEVVYLWFDPDKAGREYCKRFYQKFWGNFQIKVIAPDFDGDPDDYLRAVNDPAGKLAEAKKNSIELFHYLVKFIEESDDPSTNIKNLEPLTDVFAKVKKQQTVDIAIENIRSHFKDTSVVKIISDTVKKERYTKEVSGAHRENLPYYEQDGKYFKQTLKGEHIISSFTLRIENIILFNEEVQYQCTLVNENKEVVENVDFSPIQRVNTQKFAERCAGCGSFYFSGNNSDLAGIWQYEERKHPISVTRLVSHYGEVASQNLWLFDNCVIKEGKVYQKNKGEDVIRVGKTNYASHGVRVYSNTVPSLNLDFPFSKEFANKVGKAFHHVVDMGIDGKVEGYQGYLMFGLALAHVYTAEISKELNFFPELFGYGQAESGKSSTMGLLNKIFGWPRDKSSEGWDKATPAGTYQMIEQISSLPVYYDEFLNNRAFERMIGTIKAIYDRIGEGKGGKTGIRQVSTVNGTLWMSGQDNPADEAILSRSVFIRFKKVNDHKTKAFKYLVKNKENLSAIFRAFIIKKTPEQAKEFARKIMEIADWMRETDKTISDRVAKNYAVATAALSIFGIEHPKAEMMNYLIKHTEDMNKHKFSENPVFLFYSELAFLYQEELPNGKSVLGDDVVYQPQQKMLSFNFSRVIRKVMDSISRRNRGQVNFMFKSSTIRDAIEEHQSFEKKNVSVKIQNSVRKCIRINVRLLPEELRNELSCITEMEENEDN